MIEYMAAYDLNPFYENIINDLLIQKYAIVDNFLEVTEVVALRNHLKSQIELFHKAAIGQDSQKQINHGIRGDFILWLDNASPDVTEQMYLSKVTQFIDYINATCYLGIQDGEFHYACYPPETFYQRHLDVFHEDSRRTLSIVLYLNEDDWGSSDGGELALYSQSESADDVSLLIQPIAGRLVIFDSKEIPHAVQKTNRYRYSITGWLRTR